VLDNKQNVERQVNNKIHGLRLFESRVLRRIFELKRNEIMGG
jgi:hypothetical protein